MYMLLVKLMVQLIFVFLIYLMVSRIEAEFADRIINHLAAEMATDIKQIVKQ